MVLPAASFSDLSGDVDGAYQNGFCAPVIELAIGRTGALRFPDLAGVDTRAKERVPVWQDDHAFVLSNLGITMADGGEPIDEQKLAQNPPKGNAAKPEDPANGSK